MQIGDSPSRRQNSVPDQPGRLRTPVNGWLVLWFCRCPFHNRLGRHFTAFIRLQQNTNNPGEAFQASCPPVHGAAPRRQPPLLAVSGLCTETRFSATSSPSPRGHPGLCLPPTEAPCPMCGVAPCHSAPSATQSLWSLAMRCVHRHRLLFCAAIQAF